MKSTGFKKKTYEEKLELLAISREKKARQPKPRVSAKKRSKTPSCPSKRRLQTKASKLRRRKGLWATTTADGYFSRWIRKRDEVCLRCGTFEGLTCSHYHRRAISITRFDPENCITLCGVCHADWEGPKEGYTDFMLGWLGTERFLELQRRSGRFMKRSDAVAECKTLISTALQ